MPAATDPPQVPRDSPSASRPGHAQGVRRLAGVLVLAALTIGAPVTALRASGGTVPVEDIQIAGTPKLFVERPGSGAGYNAAWVVFTTRPHLHVVRQVVVEVRDLLGSSYSASGAPSCVRSTIIQANRAIRPGARYRVRFAARRGRTGKTLTLPATRTLVAHRFDSPRSDPKVPHCGS
jgi:hypothetical protein